MIFRFSHPLLFPLPTLHTSSSSELLQKKEQLPVFPQFFESEREPAVGRADKGQWRIGNLELRIWNGELIRTRRRMAKGEWRIDSDSDSRFAARDLRSRPFGCSSGTREDSQQFSCLCQKPSTLGLFTDARVVAEFEPVLRLGGLFLDECNLVNEIIFRVNYPAASCGASDARTRRNLRGKPRGMNPL